MAILMFSNFFRNQKQINLKKMKMDGQLCILHQHMAILIASNFYRNPKQIQMEGMKMEQRLRILDQKMAILIVPNSYWNPKEIQMKKMSMQWYPCILAWPSRLCQTSIGIQSISEWESNDGWTSLILDLKETVSNFYLNQIGAHPDIASAKLLQELKPDPKNTTWRKKTPLHWASGKGRPDCVKLLLESKADPNDKDKDGKTP